MQTIDYETEKFVDSPEDHADAHGQAVKALPSWIDWFTPPRFAALLGAFILANFASVLFGGQTFFLRDFSYFSYPLAQYHRECFWRGELPLWNPLNSCGMPFLAQWNTLTLYPPSLIYLLLPLPWSLNLFCVLHLFAGGLGMYFLAHQWTNHRFAACVAGFLFVFNGFTLNCLMWPNNIAALGLMPWVVLLAQRGWQRGGREMLLGALVGGVQMLAGAPEMILLTWVIVGALFLTDLSTKQTPIGRGLLRISLLVSFVAGLAAAQLLPFFELMKASSRSQGAEAIYWPIPAWGWANFFVPLFRSYRAPFGSYFQPDQEWVASYYTGVCGVALALAALCKVRNARVWVLAGLAAVSIAFAFGDNGFAYPALRKLTPRIEFMRFPVKFLIILNFVLPLLAAYGVAHLKITSGRRLPRPLLIVTTCVIAVISGIVWYARLHPVRLENWNVTFWSGFSRAVLLVLAIGLLCALLRMTRERTLRIVGVLILAIVFLDGLTQSPRTNPAIPTGTLQPGLVKLDPPPGLHGNRAMLTRPALDEVYSTMISDSVKDVLLHRQALFANCNLVEGIPTVDGFYSLYLFEQRQLWAKFWFHQTNYMDSPLLDFLSVAHVNAPDSAFDWTNRVTALPLATIGQRPIFANAHTTGAGLVSTTFDPRAIVYLPLDNQSTVSATNDAEARITSARITAHRLDFDVTAKDDTLLVVAQSFYGAWRAMVDGRPTSLLRANHAFQAVAIPAGAKKVAIEYRDNAFRIGLLAMGVTLLLGVALWFVFGKRAHLANL